MVERSTMSVSDETKERLSIDVSLCHRLVELEKRRLSLEAELKSVSEDIDRLHKPISNQFVRAGIKSLPLERGVRLTPRRSINCNKVGGVPNEIMAEALKKAGLGHISDYTYKWRDLKTWLKEREEDLKEDGCMPDDVQDLLPVELRSIFNIYEETKIVVYGAKALLKEKGNARNGQEED
jgi:hypothetical protein